jgi:hypothetical protein
MDRMSLVLALSLTSVPRLMSASGPKAVFPAPKRDFWSSPQQRTVHACFEIKKDRHLKAVSLECWNFDLIRLGTRAACPSLRHRC